MKKSAILFITLFTVFSSFAQQNDRLKDVFVTRYDNGYNAQLIGALSHKIRSLQVGYQWDYNVFKDKQKINATCNGGDCKAGKHYKKIEFGELYVKGKIKKKVIWERGVNNAYYYLKPKGSTIYHKNGSVYAKNIGNALKFIDIETPIYWDNGQIRTKLTNDPLDKKIQVYESYDKEGALANRITFSKTYKEPKKGRYNHFTVYYTDYGNGFLLSPYSVSASLISLGNQNYYYGYTSAGIYNASNNINLSGYMLPTIKESGNGSVLFIEDKETNEYYWGLVINGQIEMTMPATIAEKPNIDSLNNSTLKSFVTISEIKKPKNYEWKYQKNIKLKDIHNNPYSIIDIESQDIQTLNGYGISMRSVDSIFPGQIRYLKVGLFKNGKLHGMGYECKLVYLFDYANRNNNETSLYTDGMRVDAKMGIFENGILKEGRSIHAIQKDKSTDIWGKMPLPGIAHVDKKYKGKHYWYGEKMALKDLKPNDKIFVPALGRDMDVHAIDYTKGGISIISDEQGVYPTIDSNFSKVYCYVKSKREETVSCNPYEYKANYKTIKTTHYIENYDYSNARYYVKDGRRYVAGAIYKGSTPLYTTEKTVQDGYIRVTCSKCKGSGHVMIKKDFIRLVEVEF